MAYVKNRIPIYSLIFFIIFFSYSFNLGSVYTKEFSLNLFFYTFFSKRTYKRIKFQKLFIDDLWNLKLNSNFLIQDIGFNYSCYQTKKLKWH